VGRIVNKKPGSAALPRHVVGAAGRARSYKLGGARSVGSFVPGLTRKAFEKHGFSTAALLTDWAGIVGADLASYSAPERLRWQRCVAASGVVEEGAAGRPGATLLLRVEGSRAIEVQMRAQTIIDRINAYFGYGAVAELRLIQGPLMQDPPVSRRRPALPVPPRNPSPELAGVADSGLREALARLEASLRAERGR